METGRKKYPKKISRRILLLCFELITILCTGILILSYNMYRNNMYKRYSSYAKTLLRLAIEKTDSQGIEEAIEKQEKNKAYVQMENEFNIIMNHSETKYIYAVYFEKNEQMRYVLNGYSPQMEEAGEQEVHKLGDLPKPGDFEEGLIEKFNQAYHNVHTKETYYIGLDYHQESLMTYYSPLYNDKGEVVCVMAVDISMNDIDREMQKFIKTAVTGVVILGILYLAGLFFLLRYRIIYPVRRLAYNIQNFIKQQEKKEPEELVLESANIHSQDEIQLLSDSMEYMVNQLKDYMENVKNFTIDQERVNAQFAVVQQLKENLFPFQFPVYQDRTDFDVYAKIKFSKEQSGDFYNFFLIDDQHFCFFAGTASGTGVTTTMIAMITTIYMENYARLGYMPNRILAETNNRLSENNSEGITVSAFLGLVDLGTGEFTYARAGDMQPVMKQAGEEAEVLDVKECFQLGALLNVAYIQQKRILTQGESILIYTDGVPLRKDNQDYEFSRERLLLEWNKELNSRYKLEDLVTDMMDGVDKFANGVGPHADETMLVFRYFGK